MNTSHVRLHEESKRQLEKVKKFKATFRKNRFSGEETIVVFEFSTPFVDEADTFGVSEAHAFLIVPKLPKVERKDICGQSRMVQDLVVWHACQKRTKIFFSLMRLEISFATPSMTYGISINKCPLSGIKRTTFTSERRARTICSTQRKIPSSKTRQYENGKNCYYEAGRSSSTFHRSMFDLSMIRRGVMSRSSSLETVQYPSTSFRRQLIRQVLSPYDTRRTPNTAQEPVVIRPKQLAAQDSSNVASRLGWVEPKKQII